MTETLRGAGPAGFAGDNGPAATALLNNPGALAFDSAGNLYISDIANGRIRRVAPAGIISTFANAAGAGLGVDSIGNLYLTTDNTVRRITSAGAAATFAGTGTSGLSGGGASATNGAASEAALAGISGIAVDNRGGLVIAVNAYRQIRCISPAGVISTYSGGVAGFAGDDGSASGGAFQDPLGLATDAVGNLFIADQRNFRVRKLTPARIVAEGVTNGATFQPGPVAPGQIISIFGFNLGPAEPVGLHLNADGRAATSLAGTQVTFDGVPTPLLLVSSSQINAIVPYGVSGTTRLQVTNQNRPTNTVSLPVAPSSPESSPSPIRTARSTPPPTPPAPRSSFTEPEKARPRLSASMVPSPPAFSRNLFSPLPSELEAARLRCFTPAPRPVSSPESCN